MAKLILIEDNKEVTTFLSSKGFTKKTSLGFGKFRYKHDNGSAVHFHNDLQWLHYDSNGQLKRAHTGLDKLKGYLK
jgi:hypothetical protein